MFSVEASFGITLAQNACRSCYKASINMDCYKSCDMSDVYFLYRSPNPPNIPGGPAHKLAANYYYIRDHRRDVLPPTIISSFQSLPLPAAAEGEK